jgi:hypothetical protein
MSISGRKGKQEAPIGKISRQFFSGIALFIVTVHTARLPEWRLRGVQLPVLEHISSHFHPSV